MQKCVPEFVVKKKKKKKILICKGWVRFLNSGVPVFAVKNTQSASMVHMFTQM